MSVVAPEIQPEWGTAHTGSSQVKPRPPLLLLGVISALCAAVLLVSAVEVFTAFSNNVDSARTIGSHGSLYLHPGNYEVLQNPEDATFPLVPRNVLITGPTGPLAVHPTGTGIISDFLTIFSSSLNQSVDSFSVSSGAFYSISVSGPTATVQVARSTGAVAVGVVPLIVAMVLALAGVAVFLTLVLLGWDRCRSATR